MKEEDLGLSEEMSLQMLKKQSRDSFIGVMSFLYITHEFEEIEEILKLAWRETQELKS